MRFVNVILNVGRRLGYFQAQRFKKCTCYRQDEVGGKCCLSFGLRQKDPGILRSKVAGWTIQGSYPGRNKRFFFCSLPQIVPNGGESYLSSCSGLTTCWDCGYKSREEHGCLSLVSVLCVLSEVSATSWSLVQRIPSDCAASEWLWSIYNEETLAHQELLRHGEKESPPPQLI